MTTISPTPTALPSAAPLPDQAADLYASDRYLDLTGGTWHIEDSPFKAKYVDLLASRNQLSPKSVCEIGCGAGAVLAELRSKWTADVDFVGYEVSPQAHQLSQQFAQHNLRYVLGDAFALQPEVDLALVMDVVEHVEDCFDFLRKARVLGRYKIYHIPLEITCTSALRDLFGRGYEVGHIHHFSLSSALAALRYTGHRVIDYHLTPIAFERAKLLRTRFANLFRRCLPAQVATRVLGGYSLMALAT